MIATPYPLTLQDLPGLLAVQRACYGEGYLESAEVYARRLVSPAQCSLVLKRESRVCAYLAAYDSVAGQVTPLHGEFVPVAEPDTLYLHDLAVLPELGGQGMAARLLRTLWQGAQGFWQRHGYVAYTLQDTAQRERLAAYGRDAVYMMRRLDGSNL